MHVEKCKHANRKKVGSWSARYTYVGIHSHEEGRRKFKTEESFVKLANGDVAQSADVQ